MLPVTIDFTVNTGGQTVREESLSLETAAEFFDYIAPGGGCEKMPSDLCEVQMIFAPSKHPNVQNPIADKRATLELGMVFLTGSLAVIVELLQEIIDKVGRGEVSEAFMNLIHAEH